MTFMPKVSYVNNLSLFIDPPVSFQKIVSNVPGLPALNIFQYSGELF